MKKLMYLFSLVLLLVMGLMPLAHAEFPERPVGLVVLDYGRNVDTAFYKEIYAPVKWAYHFPNYKIVESDELSAATSAALSGKKVKVTPEMLNQLAEQHKMDVLVVAQIYETSEVEVMGMFSRYEGPTRYIRVTCMADLYCYRKDTNKLLAKRLRDSFVTDHTGYEKPQEKVKWQLCKLVNTMEGRPIIGGDK